MRKILPAIIALLFPAYVMHAQTVFWSENFNNSCSASCTAVGYNGGNGAWTQTVTGVEGADPNMWYVSCAENGHTAGICGTGCQPASATATLASLHVGSNPNSLGDVGAAYDAGGLCGFWTCPQTSRRIESPTINCTGQTSITLAFNYIENGAPPNDDASVWYYDGATWSLLVNTPQTVVCGSGQGQWTAFSIALPASADNNPNVKVGFLWVNNDDGVGTDPSFAVDDVTLSVASSSAPVSAFTASATSVCIGQSVNFTDISTGGPTAWAWTFPGGTPATASTQNVSGVTWSVAGTYSVTLAASNASGTSTSTVVITVNASPTVTASGNPTSICANQTVTLTGGGANTYVWNPGSIPGSPVNVNPAATTTYTVVGTDVNGCTISASVTITVVPCSTPTVDFAASDTTICVGDCISFTDMSTNSPNSWSWTFNGAATASSTAQNPTNICYNTPGTYSVTLVATNTFGSGSLTKTGYITVNPPPTVTASANPTTICANQTSTLTGSGASSYVWNPGSIPGSPVNVNPAATTTYSVVGTDVNGCTNTASVTITVVPCAVPNVDFLASDTTICVGDCINYTDLSTNNPTTWSWTFSGAATATSNVQNPTNICYNSPGVFAVTLFASNANGSGSLTKTGYITVNPPPAAFAGADITICNGQQTTLNGSGGVGYLWQPGNQPTSSYTVTPASTTTYTLTVTDAIGCTAQDQVTVTVQTCTFPTSAFTASETNFCAGTCIDFTDNSTGSPTGWSWQFPGATPSTSTQQNPSGICYNTPGTYTITLIVTNAFGADTTTTTVTAGAPPTADAGTAVSIAIGNQTTLTATGGTGTYSWSPATGLGSPNSASTTASPTVTTTYTVTFTDANGCAGSDTVTVFVVEAYGIFIPTNFSPNGDGANDQLFVYGAGIKTLEFAVYNRFGEKVFESTSVNDGWDGTYKGKPENNGVFAWYCTATFYDGTMQTLKGDVTLTR